MDVSKSELRDLYDKHTNLEACEILGVSEVTLVKYLKLAEIPLKGKGGGFAGGRDSIKIRLVD